MTTAKKTADSTAKATDASRAAATETFAERQTRETTEAGNIVKGSTEPTSRRDLKHDTEVVDEQARINKEVEEAQKATGSTASDKPGPKA